MFYLQICSSRDTVFEGVHRLNKHIFKNTYTHTYTHNSLREKDKIRYVSKADRRTF